MRPPLISLDSPYYQGSDERYRPDGLDGTDPSQVRGESLADVEARVRPWWERCLLPRLSGSTTLLVVTHAPWPGRCAGCSRAWTPRARRAWTCPPACRSPTSWSATASGWRLIGPGTYSDPDAAKEGIRAARDLGRGLGDDACAGGRAHVTKTGRDRAARAGRVPGPGCDRRPDGR